MLMSSVARCGWSAMITEHSPEALTGLASEPLYRNSTPKNRYSGPE